MPENWEGGGFGVYIHWPFCQAKCPYCDFNSHVAARIDQTRWLAAYLRELERAATETPGRIVSSVFFGGGTPSLMEPEIVAGVTEAIRRHWRTVNDLEVTLEANPTSVEAGRFRGYRDAGVSRVSIGVQALNDADLKALGRLHTAAEAMAAFDLARGIFERVSFDLIYARQGQEVAAWRKELKQALSLAVDHLSLYQLTIEDGTAFGDRFARGTLRGLPDEDLAADMFEVTQEVTDAAGFGAYEVSNHARPGAESRHNLIYWRSGDWLGIGPGAHGRLTFGAERVATEQVRAPGAWLEVVEQRDVGPETRESLSGTDWTVEALLMGLRLADGVPWERLGPNLSDYMSKIKELDKGMVEVTETGLRVLPAYRPVLNAVLREILAD